MWIARLPQEDFCQATGRPPTQRYERDGGPSMNEILEILATSAYAERDRANFVLAQLTFWLLAATDGHAKNFSIHHLAGGAFEMTPLYDVLSAWPAIGNRTNQLPLQDAKLAMAVAGKNRHYKLVDIQPRHWQALATRIGGPELWDRMQSPGRCCTWHVRSHRPSTRLPRGGDFQDPARRARAVPEILCSPQLAGKGWMRRGTPAKSGGES